MHTDRSNDASRTGRISGLPGSLIRETMRQTLFLLALFAHVLAPASFAQEANPLASYIQLHYTKQEHRVAMRDGVKPVSYTHLTLPTKA